MDILFNVIYVPGTVKYLRLPVLTLLTHSRFRFRLVGNGVTGAELDLLKRFAERHDRLEVYRVPTSAANSGGNSGGGAMSHGLTLNHLLDMEESPFFAMVDPDIFATDLFEDRLAGCLEDCDVFSSCYPTGWDPGLTMSGFSGICVSTPGGVPLATTYLAVYRTDPLRSVVSETGVGFESYCPSGGLPDAVKSLEIPDDLSEVPFLDTGKLMNILLASRGGRFRYEVIPSLIHVGGLSSFLLRESGTRRTRRALRRWLRIPYTLRDDNLDREISRRRERLHRDSVQTQLIGPRQETPYLRAISVRKRVATFFMHYLRWLYDSNPKPISRLNDPGLREMVDRTCEILKDLYDREDAGGGTGSSRTSTLSGGVSGSLL